MWLLDCRVVRCGVSHIALHLVVPVCPRCVHCLDSRRDYHDYAPDPDTPADGLRTSAEFAFNPSGSGKILMWTVLWDRTNAPTTGVIIGEMTDGPDAGKRFTANTRDNELGKSTIEWLLSGDRTDAAVVVASDPEPTRGVNYKCWFAKPGVGAASAAL